MRSETIRTYKTVHTWTGIVAGLFLFVAFYAGALSIFEPALTHWASPPRTLPLVSLEQAPELIERTIAAEAQARREFTLHLGEGHEVPARLTWRMSRHDTEPHAATLDEDGGVSVTRLRPAGLGQFVDDLHRSAGLPGDVELGAAFMGVVSMLYVLALVSGVVIVVPSLVRDLCALRIGPNLKRMWMDAHNLVGIVSLPFHFFIAVTAVVFGLHDEIYDVLDRVVYEGQLKKVFQVESPFAGFGGKGGSAPMLPPTELLSRLQAAAPDFQPTAMDYRNAGTQDASVMVWGTDERQLMRGRGFAIMDAVSGEVVNASYLPGHQNGYSATVSAFFALHMGSFGGPAVKWGYFVLGLAGAFLFYSGNLLWIETRRRRDKDNGGGQSRSTRAMAALTVGICLGCVAGISVAVAASKWLHGVVDDLGAWQWGLYYAVLVAAVAWAFRRGAARAGYELSWLAVAATLAVPLTSMLAWLVPGLGLWAWGGGIGIDLGALAGAIGMAMLARAARRRAHSTPADSVWARAGKEMSVPA